LAQRLAADPQSGIWLGLTNGDLARYRSGKVETFPYVGHPNSKINALIATSDGSILGATAFGVLGWKNGVQQILTVRNGLPCDTIHALISDDQGDLWLHAQCGLIEIPNDEMERWWEQPEHRLKLKVFDALDGVQSGQGHFTTSARSPDGRLWFATRGVLQMVDPARMAGNTVAPPVDIHAIVADRKSYSLEERLRLPPLTRDLQIDYTALSFTVPQKVVFRYMLEGHDVAWQEPGTRRQAFYNDLGPGTYRFRVIASNNDGVWNEAGAFVDFSVAPAFYQAFWFQATCVIAFLASLWGIYRYRLHHISREFNVRLEERVGERTRIARDLHDTLLQSFHGLMLRLQVVDELLPQGKAKEVLEQTLERADQAIAEGRNAVYDLRSSATITNDLEQAVEALGHELATQGAPAFHMMVEGPTRGLRPIIRDELYRISREALRNAFSHAGAHNIEAEITYTERLFRLRIRDDGEGIAPTILEQGRSGHYGLPGMRELARQIGAELNIWSGVGAGTEIELSIPGSLAYGTSPGRFRFRLFRKRAGEV
jgi:signal transduction histidine kinase